MDSISNGSAEITAGIPEELVAYDHEGVDP